MRIDIYDSWWMVTTRYPELHLAVVLVNLYARVASRELDVTSRRCPQLGLCIYLHESSQPPMAKMLPSSLDERYAYDSKLLQLQELPEKFRKPYSFSILVTAILRETSTCTSKFTSSLPYPDSPTFTPTLLANSMNSLPRSLSGSLTTVGTPLSASSQISLCSGTFPKNSISSLSHALSTPPPCLAPNMGVVCEQFGQMKTDIFCTIPKIGTDTFRNISMPFNVSLSAMSCGVLTITAPTNPSLLEYNLPRMRP